MSSAAPATGLPPAGLPKVGLPPVAPTLGFEIPGILPVPGIGLLTIFQKSLGVFNISPVPGIGLLRYLAPFPKALPPTPKALNTPPAPGTTPRMSRASSPLVRDPSPVQGRCFSGSTPVIPVASTRSSPKCVNKLPQSTSLSIPQANPLSLKVIPSYSASQSSKALPALPIWFRRITSSLVFCIQILSLPSD